MKPFRLTVFTEPIKAEGFIDSIKSFWQTVKLILKGKKMPMAEYGGHYSVTRSLIEGLKKEGIDYNYNPRHKKEIADNVIVLAGVQRLKEMIGFKRKGNILKLLAGPNVVEDVRAENAIVADPAINYYIVPSEWVKDLAENDCPNLKNRVRSWAAGIDTDYWKPLLQNKKTTDVLIYWKTEPEMFYKNVVESLDHLGLTHTTIRYGFYTVSEYKEKLESCRFGLYISRSESQGIALLEAWSMNVPTFVYEPGEFVFHGRTITNVSSCPYLVRSTGLKWRTPGELRELLIDKNSFAGYSPREYVLSNFTDELCASRLVSLFKN